MNLSMCEVPVHPVEYLPDAGRSVQLTDTVNDQMDYLEVRGDSWQLVQERGRNIIDCYRQISTLFTPGEGSLSGRTIRYGTQIFENDWIKKNIKPNTTYRGKMTITVNEAPTEHEYVSTVFGLYFYRIPYDNDSEDHKYFDCWICGTCRDVLHTGDVINTHTGFTMPENLDDISCFAYASYRYIGDDGSNKYDHADVTFSNIMLSEADVPYEPFRPATPSPEYPSEIKSVGGEMVSSGWNLFNAATMSFSHCTKDGDIFVRESAVYDSILGMADWIPEPAHDYTVIIDILEDLNVRVDFVSDNRFYFVDKIQELKKGRNIVTVRTKDTYEGVSLGSIWVHSLKDIDSFRFRVQILDDHVSLPYDRHRGNSIAIPTLRGLPDGTRDVLYADRRAKRALVERRVGVKVFDGSADENWKLIESEKGFYISVSDMVKGKLLDGYCNRFSDKKKFTEQSILFGYGNSVIYFTRTFDIADTLETWKAWLSKNSVTVQYALATPVIEELTYTDYLLDTAQYQTNISFVGCDEHLQPEIVAGCKVLGRSHWDAVLATEDEYVITINSGECIKIGGR